MKVSKAVFVDKGAQLKDQHVKIQAYVNNLYLDTQLALKGAALFPGAQ